MKYAVTSMSVDPRTGAQISAPRIEEIDTEANELFGEAHSPWDVEDVYHAFWNRLNDSWEHSFPSDHHKVVVLSVLARDVANGEGIG
jgi:hypothetical protein